MSLELIISIIFGGLFVMAMGSGAMYYQKQIPSNKQLSRDFLIGAAFTGFLYPLIPETFDDVIKTTATGLQTTLISLPTGDPGVQVGPASF